MVQVGWHSPESQIPPHHGIPGKKETVGGCMYERERERELEKASNISFSKEYIINASGIDLPGSQTP